MENHPVERGTYPFEKVKSGISPEQSEIRPQLRTSD